MALLITPDPKPVANPLWVPEVKEHIEIYYQDEWLLGVFYKENDTDGTYSVQIINHEDVINVEPAHVRKFEGCSDLEFFYNFCTLFLGVGIFTLPSAMKEASVIPAIFMFGLSLWLVYITSVRILQLADRYCVDNLALALPRLLVDYPPWVVTVSQYASTVFLWVSTILCLIGYYTVIHNQNLSFLGYAPSEEATKKNQNSNLKGPNHLVSGGVLFLAAVLSAAFSVMPEHWLAQSSLITIIVTVLILFTMCYAYFADKEKKEICYFPGAHDWIKKFKGTFLVLANTMMAACVQMFMPSVYRTMQIRDFDKAKKSMFYGTICVFALYTIFSVFGYLKYGSDVKSDVLDSLNLKVDDTATQILSYVCRGGAIVCCLCIAPLIFLTMAVEAEGWIISYYLKLKEQRQDDTKINRTVVIIVKGGLIAVPALMTYGIVHIFGKELDTINHYNGVVNLFWFSGIIGYVSSDNKSKSFYGKLDVLILVICLGATIYCALNPPKESEVIV